MANTNAYVILSRKLGRLKLEHYDTLVVVFRQSGDDYKNSGLISINLLINICMVGGSPGLVVMGRDSCFKGRGFESWHHILDGHFFTYICCKNCIVCLKKTKNKRKRGRVGPFFKSIKIYLFIISSSQRVLTQNLFLISGTQNPAEESTRSLHY